MNNLSKQSLINSFIFVTLSLILFSFNDVLAQNVSTIGTGNICSINTTGNNQNCETSNATGPIYTGNSVNSIQTGNNNLEPLSCESDKYDVVGQTDMKVGKIGEYSISLKKKELSLNYNKIEYKLFKGTEFLKLNVGDKFDYSFLYTGTYNLQVKINENDGCEYLVTKEIKVFNGVLVYIGEQGELLDLGFERKFNQKSIVLKKIILSDKTFFSEKEFNEKLNENTFYLKNSDFIIIDSVKFNNIFEQIGIYSKSMTLDLSDKNIFVVNDLNQDLFKRLIAKYLKNLGVIRINVVPQSQFLNFLSDFSKLGNSFTNGDYIKIFTVSFNDVPKYRIFSFFVDYLIYNGFPTNLISLFLALAVCALIVSIFKQIIGFSVFSIYSPLLFAVSMLVLGIKFSFILLLIAFIATYLTRFFTKKIYLLYSAKMSMLIILYILVTILTFGIDKFLGLNIIDYNIFNNSLILFPIIILIVVADKVFYEGFSIISKTWLVLFIEFLIVSFCVYYLLSWNNFQFFLLAFPEFIIIVFILNIIVGRFTGLQLLEYIRFLPLIKNSFEEEEE